MGGLGSGRRGGWGDASLIFYRSNKPHIDECGFESYSFKCRACGSMLTGIIDPADDALLVTVSS
jgi:hypothetical protein